MTVDLHNHTALCNHATGNMEQYILRAIELGIDIYGFSDHAPMDFDTKYRMSFEQMPKYENKIKELQNKYSDKIEILSAYEVDFMDDESLMDKRVLNSDVDYLIGSIHFVNKWGFDNPEFIGEYESKDLSEIWHQYFDTVKNMAKSKLFNIAGHLDLIKVFNFFPKNLDIKSLIAPVLQEIKKADMAIELNTAGYRKPVAQIYPSTDILKLIKEMNIPITFGADAHSVDQVGLNLNRAKKLALDIGFKEFVIFKKKEMKFSKL